MCLTFISVIEIIYLKKENVIQASQGKLFGIKLEQELHGMEVALHACLHQTCELPEIWPSAPLSLAGNTEVAADSCSHQVRMLRAESRLCLRAKVTMVANGPQVNKQIHPLRGKPVCECNTSGAALSAPCWGQLWATLWAEMTSWACTRHCLGVQGGTCSSRAWGSTGTQLLTRWEWNPASVAHKNLWRSNLETQNPRGKHPFPEISSEGHWLPSATRSQMMGAILIPSPTTPTWIWRIPCKWR